MAECFQASDNSNKIMCRSRHAVINKAQTIYNSLLKVLEKDAERTDENRKRYIQKFKEVYEKVSQQNIEVNGESWEEMACNTTPEYEPVNKEEELCINEDLLPKLDDCVVRIAKQRKGLPMACFNEVRDFANHQASYMSTVKPMAEGLDTDTVISEAKDAMQFINCQRLNTPCSSLSRLAKTMTKDQERAKHLSKAVEIEAANRDCQTAEIWYRHTSVTVTDCASQPTYSNKRKPDFFDGHASSSKIAKFCHAQTRDFVVHPVLM